MKDNTMEFLENEADAVREMCCESIKELNHTEKMAAIGTAAIWTWWLGLEQHQFNMLLVIPVFQTVLALRAWSIYAILKANRCYLKKVEAKLNVPEGFGWGNQAGDKSRKLRILSGVSFWFVLTCTSIIGTIFYWLQMKK